MLKDKEIVARVEGVTAQRLELWVTRGWVRPIVGEEQARGYTEADVARVSLICDLHDTMGLDEEAVPMVLNLIDQIHGLRRELKCLTEAVENQPHEVRRAVRAYAEQRFVRWRGDVDPD